MVLFDAPQPGETERALIQIVEVTNDLLRAGLDGTEAAINRALAQVGQLVGVDRATVIRLRGDDLMDNTHEWLAPGVAPMRAKSQGMPTSLLEPWRDQLYNGITAAVTDTAALPEGLPAREILEAQGIGAMLVAPMLSEGWLSGFAAFDVIGRPRTFGPFEMRLLQTLANAIGVMLDRATAAAEATATAGRLQKKGDRIQAILDAMPDLVLEIDAEGRFVSHNITRNDDIFAGPELFMGRLIDEVVPPDGLAQLKAALAEIAAGAARATFEFTLSLDLRPCVRICTVTPRMLNGRRDGCIAFVRDVTQERAREYQLARLSKVATLTSNLIIMTDAETRIEWVNPAFERRTGWTVSEVIGRTPRDLVRADQADADSVKMIEMALVAQSPVQTEILNRTRDGEVYWIAMDIQPVSDAAGKVLGFISVQTDITQIKQSHERQMQDWQAAIEAASDGVAVLSPDGAYRYMNHAYREMFGLDARLSAETILWRDLHPDAPLPRTPVVGPPQPLELRGRHREGRVVQQDLSVSPREDGCLLVISREISERTRLAVEREALREQIQKAQRQATIAQIAGHVAHDLNNVIAVVGSASEALEPRLRGDAQAMASLNQIRRATDMAGALVTGMTQLGKRPPAPASHDLRTLVTRGVELIGRPRIEAHRVRVDLPEGPVPVWVEATRLLQVVVNLVLNACESHPDRPAKVSVAVSPGADWQPGRAPDIGFYPPGKEVALLTVTDTGAGLEPDRVKQIFQPYYTTKGDVGTGLGLPIVALALNESTAALWFDSTPGKGTVVTVALPAVPEVKAAAPRDTDPVLPDGAQIARRQGAFDVEPGILAGRNILVVDDTPDVADLLAEQLERAGAVTVALSDPQEAAELLAADPGEWSALVTDQSMPGLTGAELACIAASLTPSVPALIVTTQPEKVRAQYCANCVILSKPVRGADLVRSVCDMVTAGPAG